LRRKGISKELKVGVVLNLRLCEDKLNPRLRIRKRSISVSRKRWTAKKVKKTSCANLSQISDRAQSCGIINNKV